MFNHFDKLTTKHRVFKVETIGDSYFACSGVVSQQPFHTANLVAFALDCQRAIRRLVTSDGQHVRIRIGLHTGPVIAGVVGRKMPRYHLFGSTISIAGQFENQVLCLSFSRIRVHSSLFQRNLSHPAFRVRPLRLS
jgi:class 3 adenylate cyclase